MHAGKSVSKRERVYNIRIASLDAASSPRIGRTWTRDETTSIPDRSTNACTASSTIGRGSVNPYEDLFEYQHDPSQQARLPPERVVATCLASSFLPSQPLQCIQSGQFFVYLLLNTLLVFFSLPQQSIFHCVGSMLFIKY
jgi:hypothetical protein